MNKLITHSGKIAFALLALLVCIMAAATFIEKEKGSAFVYEQIYYAFPFKFLWLLTAAAASIHLVMKNLYKQQAVFLLHLSFFVILLGALVTHFTSLSGYIRLREGEAQHIMMLSEKRGMMALPFSLLLDEFEINYYNGTEHPSNYTSRVTVTDTHGAILQKAVISMNNIFTYRGYRFYQSSFDQDKKGSILSVNRDLYGIPITYAGYALLFLASFWLLIAPKGGFRRILKHPLLKGTLMLIVALPAPLHSAANTPPTIDRTQAETLEQLWIHYNGRICPLQTFARDVALKLTDKTSYKGLSGTQLLSGFLFFPEQWDNEPILSIEHARLKQLLHTENERVSYSQFFDEKDNYLLNDYVNPDHHEADQTFQKAVQKIHDKVQLIFMLQNGYYMDLFPVPTAEGIKWCNPVDELPASLTEREQSLIKNALGMYRLCVVKHENELADQFLARIREYQVERGGDTLPSEGVKKAELCYNRLSPFKYLFMIDLTIGLLILMAFTYHTVKERPALRFRRITQVALLLLFALHTASIGLRAYISGRIPMSNGYETMLIVSWSALFISVCFIKRGTLMTGMGILLSGFTLLVAHIAMLNPQITPLVPVLTSPLLTIHVAVIMMAYALAGFIALNSLITFFILLFTNIQTANASTALQVRRLRLLSELFLYPCTFLLGIGIFIGAIWANVSWGRYWGWDPKEVWALISFIIYAFAFHKQTLPLFRNDFFFHLYGLFAFASILMTYFGVNFFLGGMHSYAGNSDLSGALIWMTAITMTLLLLVLKSGRKWQKIKQIKPLAEQD